MRLQFAEQPQTSTTLHLILVATSLSEFVQANNPFITGEMAPKLHQTPPGTNDGRQKQKGPRPDAPATITTSFLRTSLPARV